MPADEQFCVRAAGFITTCPKPIDASGRAAYLHALRNDPPDYCEVVNALGYHSEHSDKQCSSKKVTP